MVAVLPPARVPVLVASLWPPRVLALERAVVSSLPRAPVQALAVALTPRALALQRVVVLMPRALARVLVVALMMPALVLPLAVASTRALVLLLPGPFYVCTAKPVLGSTVWSRPTTD